MNPIPQPTIGDKPLRNVRIAAVQMESMNGDIKGNLERATPLVEQASEQRAEIIILPEFMPTGYVFTKAIWDAAEPKEGPTVRWLQETSRRVGAYLGTSFLEADGEDFFNTFVMTRPDGREAGRVRKQTPAAYEACFTKGDGGPHVIHTEWGKIGIGICYENRLAFMPKLMCQQSVDMLIMPHSAPSLAKGLLLSERFVKNFNGLLDALASRYASMLGIPVIMVNKCGPWNTPLPGLPFMTQKSKFPGLSTIVDSNGTVKAKLQDEEGVIVEDVHLDPSRKVLTPPRTYGRWAAPEPRSFAFTRLVEAFGGLWYKRSAERRKRARAISSPANS